MTSRHHNHSYIHPIKKEIQNCVIFVRENRAMHMALKKQPKQPNSTVGRTDIGTAPIMATGSSHNEE